VFEVLRTIWFQCVHSMEAGGCLEMNMDWTTY